MKPHTNIVQYLDHIIASIKTMEKNSEVFTELKTISTELEVLESYVKTTLETLENNFNTYVRQINLLSELVDFQRSVVNFRSSENIVLTLFDFLYRNLKFNHAFIAFKLNDNEEKYTIVTSQQNQLETYQKFVENPEIRFLETILQERDMAYLMTEVHQFSSEQIPWQLLDAKSAILFPVKVKGKFLGIGFIIRKAESFELNDLSFINLVIGIVSMLIYQHFYFSRLKTRLFKQFRLRKMLEEVKYAEYFEKGPLYIFTLDPRFVILHANSAAISRLKISEEMIIGDNFLEIIPKSHQQGFKKVLMSAEEQQVGFYRSPLMTRNKMDYILEFYVSKIELRNHFSLLLVFAIDTTQMYYKDLLFRRNEILDELDQLSRTLIGEFTNLLSILVPNISLLRTQLAPSDPNQRQLESMERAIGRSSNLIQKFLNYDLEELEIPQEANINKIIRSFVAQFKNEAADNVDVKFRLDPGVRNSVVYPLRLRQLLKILLENSMLAVHEREKGEVSISTRLILQTKDGIFQDNPFYLTSGNYLELVVTDNGCGIPQTSLPQVYKPFYSTRIKNEGVGLGLFIAYNIVKDMKGQIFIESEFGKFTSVYIYLPVKEEKVIEPAVASRTQVKKMKKTKPTVLIVDDEYNIRSMMKEIMEMNGFSVYTAGNGEEGVETFLRHKEDIDLVILDMVMPVMDGRAAFKEIKKISSQQKILIISGYSRKEDLDEILQKGAVGFMRKPFQVFEIVNRIREILKINPPT